MDEIDAVTADDVQALARELFRDEHLNMVVIGPYDSDAALASHLTFGD